MSHRIPDAALGAIVARLTVDAGELMHAVQSERGLSVMHVVSPERRRMVLDRAWMTTDGAVGHLLTTLGRSQAVVPRIAVELFADMRELLHVRPRLQAAVVERQVSPREVVARYSAIIGLLLAGLDECADLVHEPALAGLFEGHRALMRAEEEAALSRTYGTLMLAGHAPHDAPILSRLLAQQQLHLAAFAVGALPRVRSVLDTRVQHPAFQRAEQLERLAAAMGPHHDLLTSDEWYQTLTAKLRALHEVDDLDASVLLERAEENGLAS